MNKNKVEEIFGRKKVLLPVIHVDNKDQALYNTALAIGACADGVFLINHHISYRELIKIYNSVRKRFSDVWIGINFLDLENNEAAREVIKIGADGLWTDQAGIYENASKITFSREELLGNWQGLYFGGVAFKYQKEVEDLVLVSQRAIDVVDVVTTSGNSTGSAPLVAKIQIMKEAIKEFPLAIASGISPENVRDYLPFCDCFLVATGISVNHRELDFERTRNLTDIIHGWKK